MKYKYYQRKLLGRDTLYRTYYNKRSHRSVLQFWFKELNKWYKDKEYDLNGMKEISEEEAFAILL